jgi:hypothetical protein
MKSCVTGPIIRRLRVITPTGLGKAGSLTGKTLTDAFFAPKHSTDADQIANRFPPAIIAPCNGSELDATSAASGTDEPQAAKVSVMSSSSETRFVALPKKVTMRC